MGGGRVENRNILELNQDQTVIDREADRQAERQTPEGLRVDVGQPRVVAQLQFDEFWKVLESCSLHHQQLLHVVEAEAKTQQTKWSCYCICPEDGAVSPFISGVIYINDKQTKSKQTSKPLQKIPAAR